MSVENLKEYARRCATEPELRAKAKEIGMSDAEEHMRHAESLGLDWTLDDMAAFRRETIDSEGDLEDLSEEELEQIAGGVITVAIAVGVGVSAGVTAGVVAGAAGGAVAGGTASATGDGGW